jgi:hypothetical protein
MPVRLTSHCAGSRYAKPHRATSCGAYAGRRPTWADLGRHEARRELRVEQRGVLEPVRVARDAAGVARVRAIADEVEPDDVVRRDVPAEAHHEQVLGLLRVAAAAVVRVRLRGALLFREQHAREPVHLRAQGAVRGDRLVRVDLHARALRDGDLRAVHLAHRMREARRRLLAEPAAAHMASHRSSGRCR